MRFKWVPEPPASFEELESIRRTIPLVPAREDDCFARLRRRSSAAEIDGREAAREWLTFMRALGMVERGPSGYARTRDQIGRSALRDRLLERVYGARELLSALESSNEALSADAALRRAAVEAPTWERRRRGPDWERTWRERRRRALDWLALAGAVERTPAGYLAADSDATADG